MADRTAVTMALCAALAGCASPAPQGGAGGDANAQTRVEDRADGFLLSMTYSRYQFVPESAAVATACKQALTASAFDEAEKRGRKIDPVNEQRIRISMGRNGLTGITSCEASVPVTWAR